MPGKAKAESIELYKVQAWKARPKGKYGSSSFTRKPVFPPLMPGWYVEAKIQLGPDPHVYRHRKIILTVESKGAMQRTLRELINGGWLEPCHSEWDSRCFAVSKKVAGEWRLVVDYRGLNAQTQHVSYTLLLIEDMLKTQLPGKIFTVTDGYQQMLLADESRACTAASTPLGCLQWKVMSLGVTDGKAAFQCMLENVLELVRDHAASFVGDVIIASGDPSMSYDEVLQAHGRGVTRVLDLLV